MSQKCGNDERDFLYKIKNLYQQDSKYVLEIKYNH